MLLIITTLVGSLMGLSYLPQTRRIIQLKRSEELSITTYVIILFGASVWLIYGISRHDSALIIANICGIFGAGSVLLAALYYRKTR